MVVHDCYHNTQEADAGGSRMNSRATWAIPHPNSKHEKKREKKRESERNEKRREKDEGREIMKYLLRGLGKRVIFTSSLKDF